MPELREVFEMTTKQMGEPDLDSWHEQEKRQRNASRNKKLGAFAVAAALVIAGVMVGISALRSEDVQPAGSGSKPATGVDGDRRITCRPPAPWSLGRTSSPRSILTSTRRTRSRSPSLMDTRRSMDGGS